MGSQVRSPSPGFHGGQTCFSRAVFTQGLVSSTLYAAVTVWSRHPQDAWVWARLSKLFPLRPLSPPVMAMPPAPPAPGPVTFAPGRPSDTAFCYEVRGSRPDTPSWPLSPPGISPSAAEAPQLSICRPYSASRSLQDLSSRPCSMRDTRALWQGPLAQSRSCSLVGQCMVPCDYFASPLQANGAAGFARIERSCCLRLSLPILAGTPLAPLVAASYPRSVGGRRALGDPMGTPFSATRWECFCEPLPTESDTFPHQQSRRR